MCEMYPPVCPWPGFLTWEQGEVVSSSASPSPGLLSVREETLPEVLLFEYFIDDLDI